MNMKKLWKYLGFEKPTAEEYAAREIEYSKLKLAHALDAQAYAEAMIEYRRKQIEIYCMVLAGSAFDDAYINLSKRVSMAAGQNSGNLSS
jgi:hypothetical protein